MTANGVTASAVGDLSLPGQSACPHVRLVRLYAAFCGAHLIYNVFVSHGWHDRWIASQLAANIRRESGAETFIDVFDIQSGDRIEERVHAGLIGCNELVALLTPWSVDRNWIWTEMAAAWVQRKRYVGITYGVTLEQIGKDHGGAAILSSTT